LAILFYLIDILIASWSILENAQIGAKEQSFVSLSDATFLIEAIAI
jgi:hypothetical protein